MSSKTSELAALVRDVRQFIDPFIKKRHVRVFCHPGASEAKPDQSEAGPNEEGIALCYVRRGRIDMAKPQPLLGGKKIAHGVKKSAHSKPPSLPVKNPIALLDKKPDKKTGLSDLDSSPSPVLKDQTHDLATVEEKKSLPKKEIKVGGWELQPIECDTLTEQTNLWRKKLSAHVTTCEPEVSVFLILPEENPLHRLFLENVSRAITRSFASASVVTFDEELFCQKEGKLILAPLTLLQKKFPKANVHSLFKEGGLRLIPLENLDLYGHDIASKRALWLAIQHSFQSS